MVNSYTICVYNAQCEVDTNAKYGRFVFYLLRRCFPGIYTKSGGEPHISVLVVDSML